MPTLDWIGKSAVVNHHQDVPYRLLNDNPALSAGSSDTGNLLVQGDNLQALKALLPYYAGQVKCIYIDPPYNTGNEGWIYNDNVNSPEIHRWLGKVVGKDAEDLSRHDKWLCMMYPRLQLLHQMLCQDGVLFVSLDENELVNGKMLLCEIFGNSNFITTLVWEGGKKGDSYFFSEVHEYVLVVAKSKSTLLAQKAKWRKRKPGVDQVLDYYFELRDQLDNDHTKIRKEMMSWFRSLPTKHPAKAHKHYNWSDDRGLYFPDNFHGPDDGRDNRPRYEIIHPVTGKACALPSTGWRWEEETTKKALADVPPRIHFGKNELTIPCRKSYLTEVDTEAFSTVFYKDGRTATGVIEAILGKGKFDYPKDVGVVADLIALICGPNDIVLDSFAGSGTTGDAAMQLNKEDGGNRRVILVEMEANIAQTVTAERLRRVICGYGDTPGLGGGFRYATLGEPLLDVSGQISAGITFEDLARHIYFTETQEPLLETIAEDNPFIGCANGFAYYLLWKGYGTETVLDSAALRTLPPHDGPKVVYADGCRISAARLKAAGVVFKQLPYEIKTN